MVIGQWGFGDANIVAPRRPFDHPAAVTLRRRHLVFRW
jgi:hypothetical protein